MAFTALPTQAQIERYLGGGRLYMSLYQADGITLDPEFEVGEVKEFSLKIDPETKEAMSHDAALVKEVDEVVVSVKGSGSYQTTNISTNNKAIASLGNVTSEVFALAAILPDGTPATAETTITKIEAGKKPMTHARLRFVGAQATGIKKPVAIIHKASITSDGNIPYQMQDFQSLGFNLKILETTLGFYNEYLMDVV